MRHFFEQAKSVCLSADEKKHVRNAVLTRHIQRMEGKNAFASAKDVALKTTEKSAVKSRLAQYMQMYPVQQQATRITFMQRALAAIRNPFSLQTLPATAAIVGILVTSGGGLTYAAESSVPGDSLYSVKVNVTEPMREAMAFSASEKAKVHLWRMERRLQEAEALLLEEGLDDERREKLESYMEDHAAFLEDRLAHMRELQDAMVDDIEDDYAVLLEFHESAVGRIAEKDGEQSMAMLNHIRDMRERRFGNNFEPKHISAERLQRNIQKVEQQVARVQEEFPERAEYMQEHIEVAREMLHEGKTEAAFKAMRPQRRHQNAVPFHEPRRPTLQLQELPTEELRNLPNGRSKPVPPPFRR